MAMTIHIDIVSAEQEIFSGTANMVFAPAVLGETARSRAESSPKGTFTKPSILGGNSASQPGFPLAAIVARVRP